METVFSIDGERIIPNRHAGGPWGDSLHGGATAALFAWAFEQLETGLPAHLARLSVEIFKPVPFAPLTLHTVFARQGRRVAFAEAEARVGDEVFARATATFIRSDDIPLPPEALAAAPMPPRVAIQPEALPRLAIEGIGPFMAQLDLREVEGGLFSPGPGSIWIRPPLPIVEGYENTPAMCVAAAADCGSGVSALGYPGDLLYINPDLTITLARPAIGEWVNVTAATHPTERGHGLAEALLCDRDGYVGRSAQTLFLDVPGRAA